VICGMVLMNNLVWLRTCLQQARNIASFSELDTIERFVIPVLRMAGWEVDLLEPFHVRRGKPDNKSCRRKFDLELWVANADYPKFVFECKNISEEILLIEKGASSNRKDSTDFARQLRNYCIEGHHCFCSNYTTPVLTNGDRWILFTQAFVDSRRKEEIITVINKGELIAEDSSLDKDDFEHTIINALRRPPHQQEMPPYGWSRSQQECRTPDRFS
jgi:hypothetical protein